MVDIGTPVRIGVIALFTAVETAALAGWLRFVRDEPLLSTAVAIGLGILVVGLFIEHILTDIAVNGLHFSFPFGSIIAFSLSETVLWAIWLQVGETVGGLVGLGAAFAVLFVLLIPQHTIEDNVLRATNLFSDLVDLNTAGFSFIEAAGATVWLALVLHPGLVGGSIVGFDPALIGLGVLAASLFVEHNIGVRFSSR